MGHLYREADSASAPQEARYPQWCGGQGCVQEEPPASLQRVEEGRGESHWQCPFLLTFSRSHRYETNVSPCEFFSIIFLTSFSESFYPPSKQMRLEWWEFPSLPVLGFCANLVLYVGAGDLNLSPYSLSHLPTPLNFFFFFFWMWI